MKPQYEPKTDEQRIGYLIEECGEVLAAAGKILRWGWDSTNPELQPGAPYYGETNAEWLVRELADLKGAIRRVEEIWGCSKDPQAPPKAEEALPLGHEFRPYDSGFDQCGRWMYPWHVCCQPEAAHRRK